MQTIRATTDGPMLRLRVLADRPHEALHEMSARAKIQMPLTLAEGHGSPESARPQALRPLPPSALLADRNVIEIYTTSGGSRPGRAAGQSPGRRHLSWPTPACARRGRLAPGDASRVSGESIAA